VDFTDKLTVVTAVSRNDTSSLKMQR